MRNLKLFASHSQFIEPTDKPAVSYCELENEVHYHPDPFNGHEYVDLGLPSGTLWAKCNVGATNETDYGLYFAWGETQGYADASTKAFSWDDYKFNPSGDSETFTKYNTTDNKMVLEAEDDAATVNMGGEWHMPTKGQCEELLKETTNGFVTNTGIFTQFTWSDGDEGMIPTETTATIDGWNTAGYLFFKNTYTSVTDAISAEDYLFIPVSGLCGGGDIIDNNDFSFVWSSSIMTDNINSGYCYNFHEDGGNVDIVLRFVGQSVRGIVGNITT